MPENKVFVTDIEISILRALWDHLYLTNSEMADILEALAGKLRR